MKRRHILVAGVSAVKAPAGIGANSAWPTRGPVKLVAQFPQGGLVDTVSRMMAPHLSQAPGQTVVFENRADAGGLVGADYVFKQPADGYTLLVIHASDHIYATAAYKIMPFNPVNNFSHMGTRAARLPCRTCSAARSTVCLTPSLPMLRNLKPGHCALWQFQRPTACLRWQTFRRLPNSGFRA